MASMWLWAGTARRAEKRERCYEGGVERLRLRLQTPSLIDIFYEYNRTDFAPNPAFSVPGAAMKVEQRPADSKSKEALTDKASLLNLYREMLLIRRFEEKTEIGRAHV